MGNRNNYEDQFIFGLAIVGIMFVVLVVMWLFGWLPEG